MPHVLNNVNDLMVLRPRSQDSLEKPSTLADLCARRGLSDSCVGLAVSCRINAPPIRQILTSAAAGRDGLEREDGSTPESRSPGLRVHPHVLRLRRGVQEEVP